MEWNLKLQIELKNGNEMYRFYFFSLFGSVRTMMKVLDDTT